MICVGLVAGCGESSNNQANPGGPIGANPPGGVTDQGVYIASVLHNRDSLFAGFVITPKSLKFRLATTTSFDVVVCGADSPRKVCMDNLAAALAQQTPAPSSTTATSTPTVGATPSPGGSGTPTGSPSATTPPPSGTPTTSSTSNTTTVQIGGQVVVTVTGDPSLTIQSNSQTSQPVLLKTESASWSFNVIPSAEGTFYLIAHISVLQGANGPPLLPEQTALIPLEVYQTPTDRITSDASSFWKLVQEIATVLGATGISVSAVAVYLVRRVRRRRRERAAAVAAGGPVPPGTPPSPYPQASAPPAQRAAVYGSPPPAGPVAPPPPQPTGPPGGYPQQATPYPPIPTPPPEAPEPPTRHLGPQP
jgi:hypothetical protein